MSERNLRKTRAGMVVSDKMDKTVVVADPGQRSSPAVQEDHQAHRKAEGARRAEQLRYRRYRQIMETRPLSKDKRWRVVEIIEKAK